MKNFSQRTRRSLNESVWYERHRRERVRFGRLVGGSVNRKPIELDGWQEEVLASDAREKILNTSRQIGKSTVVAALALHKAMFFDESLILIIAPTEKKQAQQTFSKITAFYRGLRSVMANPMGVRRLSTESLGSPDENVLGAGEAKSVRRLGMEFENGSRIEAMGATETSARSFTADLVIIDEAAYVPDNFYAAIRPSLMIHQGDLVLASTPHGKAGFYYEEWKEREEEGWAWWEIPATKCPRITPEMLARERRRRPWREYQQEYMCQFVDTEGSAFNSEDVEAAYEGIDWDPF